jgi:hypothetical protein
MNDYYVGLDVHKASICIAVLNAEGRLVMESVVETSAATVLDFLKGLRGFRALLPARVSPRISCRGGGTRRRPSGRRCPGPRS